MTTAHRFGGGGHLPASANRGSSSFDVRHSLTAGFTYELARNWDFSAMLRAAQRMKSWVKQAPDSLAKTHGGPSGVAVAVASTPGNQPVLLRLLVLLHAVLERNSDARSLRVLKRQLLEITPDSAALFESARSI